MCWNFMMKHKWIILTLIALLIVYIRLNVMIQEDLENKESPPLPVSFSVKNINTFDIKIDILKSDFNKTTKKNTLAPMAPTITLKPNAVYTPPKPIPRGNIGYAVKVSSVDGKPAKMNVEITGQCSIITNKGPMANKCVSNGVLNIAQLETANAADNALFFKEGTDTRLTLKRDPKRGLLLYEAKTEVPSYTLSFKP